MSPRRLSVNEPYLEAALEVLKSGGLIISPTTTNYNILCDATNSEAVKRVFQVKKRTKVGPLPVSLPYPHLASQYVYVPDWFDEKILQELLPGEVSFIFKQKYPFPDELTCGLRTVSISCTTHPLMRSIVVGMEGPIAATSANLSGQGDIFVTLEKAVLDVGSEVDLIIDAGPTEAQLAPHIKHRSNTIIDLTFDKPYLCRKGWVSLEKISKCIPNLVVDIDRYEECLANRISKREASKSSSYWTEEEIVRSLEVIREGGLLIAKGDIGYGFFCNSEAAIRKMYSLKGRQFSNPCIVIANFKVLSEVAEFPHPKIFDWIKKTISWSTVAVVLPVRKDSVLLNKLPEFVYKQTVTNSTIAVFLRTGSFLEELIERAYNDGIIFVGTSANLSSKGNIFDFRDLPLEFLEGADWYINHGKSLYENKERLATTIVNFTDWSIKRRGVNYEIIEKEFFDLQKELETDMPSKDFSLEL